MSQEIVYTSAPRGLKPNSSGFCTVLSTNGMARNLSERLESLSGYRFHFPAHDANSHLNPVNYSHLKMTVGGEPFHVLSRICDAGLDHTKRSNKLAHHVAFKAREIKPTDGGSPAWTLAAPGFCETEWEGEPRRVAESRKRLPENQRSPQPAAVWKSLTGDAGWAGVLAESALQHPPRPMHVIFPAGTNTLSLVVEALHLLPPTKRWDVTFSTYFTRLEAGTECQWRFILDGTPEAEAIRRDPHKPKIDMSANLGQAPYSHLVDFARTGQPPSPAQAESPSLAAPTTSEHVPEPADEEQSATSHAEHAHSEESPDAERLIVAPPRASRPAPVRQKRPRRRLPLPWVIAGSLLLFLLITGGMIAAFVGGRGFRAPPGLVAENDAPQALETERKNVEVDQSVLKSVEKPAEPPPEPEPVSEPEIADSPQEIATAEPITVPLAPEPEKPVLPLADIIEVHNEHLPLPSTEQNRTVTGGGPSRLTEAAQLATIYVDDPERVTLRIEGQKAILPPGIQFAITEELSPDRSTKTWTITETNPTGVAEVGIKVGQFRLQNNQFSFQWQHNLQSAKLQYCRLIIEAENDAGAQVANCSLFEAVEQHPLRLDFDNRVYSSHLNIARTAIPHHDHLRVKISVRNIETDHYSAPRTKGVFSELTHSSEILTIDFLDFTEDQSVGQKLSQIRLQFRLNPAEERTITVNNFAYAEHIDFKQQRTDPIPREVEIGWMDDPFEFSRASEGSFHAKRKKTVADIKGYENTLVKFIDEQQARLNRAESGIYASATAKEQAVSPISMKLEALRDLQAKYQNAKTVAEGSGKWSRRLERLYSDLEREVEIDWRIYIESDGKETDILRSRSTGKSKGEATRGSGAPKGLSPPAPQRGASSDQQAGTDLSGF